MLSHLNSVIPTRVWEKDDSLYKRNTIFSSNGFEIEINKKPTVFESKIKELLEYLERDAAALDVLSKDANLYLSIQSYFYQEYNLGGYTINNEVIEKLNKMKIQLDFDMYVSGNPI